MTTQFMDLSAAADFLGPGAMEVNRFVSEIRDLASRRGIFGQRIKQVPATGHPSRFFDRNGDSSVRVEKSVPLKALVSQVNYNLFGDSPTTAYLQEKDMMDAVDGLLRTHDVALWNGNDTSLSCATTHQYFGVGSQISAGGNVLEIKSSSKILDAIKSAVAQMVADGANPTAIYANPVLCDLIDQEVKKEYNIVLHTTEVAGGIRVKAIDTQAGELPLIPDWAIAYTGTVGSSTAILPAYIVTEDFIEYHWLTDHNPRVFQLGLPGSLSTQHVVVKFGAVVAKGATKHHCKLKVAR